MPTDWQDVIAWVLVAAAVVYAVRWIFQSICARSAGCGDCSTESEAQPTSRQIVSVDDLAQSGHEQTK